MAKWIDNIKIGQLISSNSSGDFKVIEVLGSRNIAIRFVETGTEVHNLQKANVLRGNVHDYMIPTFLGLGYLGSDGMTKNTAAYNCWSAMLTRCYSESYHSTRETYRDCEVEPSWLNLTTFRKWFELNHIKGYHLDKDLLVQGNRVYSENTCTFIPQEVNAAIVEKSKVIDGCEGGVSKRRVKGKTEYNGLYNVSFGRKYLGRTRDLDEANSLYKEYKKFYFEVMVDKYEEQGWLTKTQAEALRTRLV